MSDALKKKAILRRIQIIEDAIAKGRQYLESGAHANWDGFRPLFTAKVRNGKELPPHKDWIRNVFLPRRERALRYAEKLLEKLERSSVEQICSRRRRGKSGEIAKSQLLRSDPPEL